MHAYAYANAMQLWTKHLRCYSSYGFITDHYGTISRTRRIISDLD
jgi:hypothetical protein